MFKRQKGDIQRSFVRKAKESKIAADKNIEKVDQIKSLIFFLTFPLNGLIYIKKLGQ